MTIPINRVMLFGLPVATAVTAALIWILFPQEIQSGSETEPVTLSVASIDEANDTSAGPPIVHAAAVVAPMGRLSVSKQRFSRGGLGSRALMTFTLRNRNGYAVKDIELLCRFSSKDGSYATERRRTISDTIDMKSRKVFPLTHIGFVNVKAEKAKCAVLTAERV